MFSALKKLTKTNDDRCPAPTPMSSSLQKKFSRGVHYNMKILIKGDRSVGKSCLLQRLQGGAFKEDYVPTDQIQVAPIHWTYKNTEHIVKVEVWEVVDKGKTKKKAQLGLKLENQSTPSVQDESYETPVLDATFLDVYKNTSGVILMMDITKPWTFEYVVKELSLVPADLPVVVLGNHCDMQHHRQVHPHHIDQAMHNAKLSRTAPVRYAESSMRNGFGLRLLHKFLNVPFLRLQRTSLLEQLQRNQKDAEEVQRELDDFQNSEECHYNLFLDRLANKRRQISSQQEPPPSSERSPSIVLGGGKPIVPANVNPLLAHSLNPMGLKAHYSLAENPHLRQTQYVNQELLNPRQQERSSDSANTQSSHNNEQGSSVRGTAASGALDEFFAGALDNSFLEDRASISSPDGIPPNNESDSDDANTVNPMVTNEQDDLDVEYLYMNKGLHASIQHTDKLANEPDGLSELFSARVKVSKESKTSEDSRAATAQPDRTSDCDVWARDSSTRRSPEGGEDPDVPSETQSLPVEKKQKKPKKSKDKEKGDSTDKSERKERKHKHKKSKSDKKISNPQQDLLVPSTAQVYYDDDYDSI